MKLGAVVIADETRHLLKVIRLEVDHRYGAEAVRLLPARDQCLSEETADRLPAEQPQMAFSGTQTEHPVGIRCPEPLKPDRQRLRIELLARRRRRRSARRNARALRGRHIDGWTSCAVDRPQPPVVTPH